MNSKMIKAIGMAATIIGIGVNLLTDWVDEQKMDEKIEAKVKHLPRKKKRRSPNTDSFRFLLGKVWNRQQIEPFTSSNIALINY